MAQPGLSAETPGRADVFLSCRTSTHRKDAADERRASRGRRRGRRCCAARGSARSRPAAGGQPFASLVTPATAPDLSVLLLLSALSEHTRHLRADPRCALLVAGPARDGQPADRAAGDRHRRGGARADDPALKARWLALHPYAAFYAEFADFGCGACGRGRPRWSAASPARTGCARPSSCPTRGAVAAVAAAEAAILAHCNADHADALGAIAEAHGGGRAGWRMVAVDVDGCDLGRGETRAADRLVGAGRRRRGRARASWSRWPDAHRAAVAPSGNR